jgi:hypothetical protein
MIEGQNKCFASSSDGAADESIMSADPFDPIAAEIDAALRKKDAEAVAALFQRRRQMIGDRLALAQPDGLSRALIEKLAAQDRRWLERGGRLLAALQAEMAEFKTTRQSSRQIGQAYGSAAAGRYVSSHG